MKIAMLGVKAVPCPGGICTYAEELGARLAARGHDVTIYCRRQYVQGDPSPRHPAPFRGIERHLSPGFRGKYLDAISHTFTAAVDSLFRDYDLIHIHGSAPAVVAPLLRLRRRRPVVVTIHSMDWRGDKWGSVARRAMRLAGSVAIGSAHQVTVVSRGLERHYQQAFRRGVVYIPTGVSLPATLGADEIRRRWGLEPGRYVLFVGRLTPEKGLHHLLPAMSSVQTDKRLVIVGGTNYRDPYIADLQATAEERVLFTGYQEGQVLQELFSNAYLYVQPSTLEAMPLAVLEALSYGRCVLASDIPGNQEALGGCGYTFRAGDVDDLSAKLSLLLQDEAAVAAEFEKARSYVGQEHDWDRTTREFEAVYCRLVGDHASRRREGRGGGLVDQ